jgi:hypothetical protein
VKGAKIGMFGVFIIIVIVLILLFIFGFIDRSRVEDLKDDEFCVKWYANSTKCVGYEKTKSTLKDFFVWDR